jgi:hypothetical protein
VGEKYRLAGLWLEAVGCEIDKGKLCVWTLVFSRVSASNYKALRRRGFSVGIRGFWGFTHQNESASKEHGGVWSVRERVSEKTALFVPGLKFRARGHLGRTLCPALKRTQVASAPATG